MNIENFKPLTPQPTWPEIFQKQKELKFLYEPESREIFENFDIDCYEDQEVFKKYCWRITEELMEALEDQENQEHFKEELIDGFNFTIELYLLYGWDLSKETLSIYVPTGLPRDAQSLILNIIYALGTTANLLKNRQWRQSQYLVDLLVFGQRFIKIWHAYWQLFIILGLEDEVRDLWSLKYQVNLFRINTNY